MKSLKNSISLLIAIVVLVISCKNKTTNKETKISTETSPDMVLIPGGSFMMGDDNGQDMENLFMLLK